MIFAFFELKGPKTFCDLKAKLNVYETDKDSEKEYENECNKYAQRGELSRESLYEREGNRITDDLGDLLLLNQNPFFDGILGTIVLDVGAKLWSNLFRCRVRWSSVNERI